MTLFSTASLRLRQIKNGRDRAKIRSFYIRNEKGKYEIESNAWETRSDEILAIFNAADFQPVRYRNSAYVDEAKVLIEKFLQEHPTNAEAWNIYLANYYRFRFAGGSYYFGGTLPWGGGGSYFPHEISQVKKAVALCPEDPCLQLWYQVVTCPTYQRNDAPNLVALNDEIKRRHILANDYEDIDYDAF